jgi:hypothetical protein
MKVIKKVSKEDVEELTLGAYRHKLILNGNYDLYALYLNNVPVSIGAIKYTGIKATLTFAYTPKEHQKKGYHKLLMNYRMNELKTKGIQRVEVTCLKASVGNYLREGAKVLKQYKHGGALVVYESI